MRSVSKSGELQRAAALFCAPKALPSLWFFTDPVRAPEPWRTAAQLPAGAAVVYRHFGAPDRFAIARRLQRLCARNGLVLMIGADDGLASAVGAAGVHLPERMVSGAAAIKRRRPDWIVSTAAHSAEAARRGCVADAIVLSAIYPSQSPSAGEPLGLYEGGRIARSAPGRVIALGGVEARNASALARAGFAGVAGIDLFLG